MSKNNINLKYQWIYKITHIVYCKDLVVRRTENYVYNDICIHNIVDYIDIFADENNRYIIADRKGSLYDTRKRSSKQHS